MQQCTRIRDFQSNGLIAIDSLEGRRTKFILRTILRRVRCARDIIFVIILVNLERLDFRLAIHERDVVVVQRIECTFRSIRESQQIVIAYVFRPPTSRCTIKGSIVIVINLTKTCCQRLFRIAVDQFLASLIAVRIVVLRLIERRTIDRLSIADIDDQVSLIHIDIARTTIFIPHFCYSVIISTIPRSRNRVCSNIICITMPLIIRRNGAICI